VPALAAEREERGGKERERDSGDDENHAERREDKRLEIIPSLATLRFVLHVVSGEVRRVRRHGIASDE
jgi:hypothetical protein